jgi:uncharacterized protein (UPF0276 family)
VQISAQTPIPAAAGIGLRADHYTEIDQQHPAISWLEVHTENFFGAGGIPHYYLARLRLNYPLSFHGVGLSIGSADALDLSHLKRIGELIQQYQPGLISEHLSWGSINNHFVNDLLPYPYTKESLKHFSDKVDQIQDYLGRQILIENPSTYLAFEQQDFTETEFLNQLAQVTGCGLLLDVNNVFVCATNHGFSTKTYLESIDYSHVQEIHLAGHTKNYFADGSLLIDTHNAKVCEEVWSLYEFTLKHSQNLPTLIEWDTELPDLRVLLSEAETAQSFLDKKSNAIAT